jgi:hypothetical protein
MRMRLFVILTMLYTAWSIRLTSLILHFKKNIFLKLILAFALACVRMIYLEHPGITFTLYYKYII